MSDIRYIIGNAKNSKQIFQKENFTPPNLIISSPPYFDVKNYEDNSDQIGYGQDCYEDYLDIIAQIYQDCYDLSSDNSSFWLMIDTFKKEGEVQTLPFDINNKLKEKFEKTWRLKEIIIWDKEKSLPWNGKGNFKNEFEYILFFTKGNSFKFNIDKVREINDLKKWWLSYPERYNPQGKAPSNVWQFTTPIRGWGNGNQNHLCPFPFPLVEKIIVIASDYGDLIFDPFAGSGSALAIAGEMGRNAIGIDINKKYKKLFSKEVKLGAEKYWANRVKEIEKNADAILNFQLTNNKLRKLKTGSTIANHINSSNSHKFLHFLIDSGNEQIKLYTIENSFLPIINLDDEKLQKFLKQSKIIVDSEILAEVELRELLKDVDLYKYSLAKFYSYRTKIKYKTITKSSQNPFDYMYSNIELKIY